MTREQIEVLEGADLVREVGSVLGIVNAEYLTGWALVGEIQAAMQKRGWWMQLSSPWDPAQTDSEVYTEWECNAGKHGEAADAITSGPSAWVAVARAALLAFAEE